ncbi:MAG: ATP-binding cassette domain-containing protein, partial [Chloroflexi bacterium]|nr:ATP-binding cassette domain-containing protein [Chloroflexota bacterium]
MTTSIGSDCLLEVQDLHVEFPTRDGVVKAVDGVDFSIKHNQTVGVVGESGSGKTVTALAILQVVSQPGKISGGRVLLRQESGDTVDIASLNPRGKAIRAIRGKDISMIFQ